nr:ribonuclease H-like domain-containing protein [Tanacetum cinerariifolium]
MVADLRYFNSLELEVDSLRSQLETQKTHFLNEIDRLSREYYYADHMNAILGVYTKLDEVTNLQCDYLEMLDKCECLEKELSKSKNMSKSFETLQKHAISLELELQQCKEKIKNDKLFKVNQSKEFCKEREQYFEIQDLKAQLQDKGIAISELKKLIEKLKGNSVDTKTKMPIFVPVSTRETKRTVNQSVEKPIRKTVNSESNQKPRNTTRKLYERVSKTCSWWHLKFTPSRYNWKPKSKIGNVNLNLVEIILFIVDSGCSKHMTGNLKLLINFVEKFLGTIKFGNDQIAPILGYGDLSTCYIRDLKGNDLLTGSRGTDMYSITLQDTSSSNLICLMAKATSSQAWLWHRRLSHLNFDTINLLSKNDIAVGLPKLKFVKDHLCSSCELWKAKRKSFQSKITPSSKRRLQLLHMDLCGPMRVASINGKRYVLVIVDNHSRYTDKGTKFLNQTLHARNRTLVEAARTMLCAAKVPLFFWAKAIATTCFTQNRSLVIPRHEKIPYHIINDRKPSVKFFRIFSSLCYIVRDGENLDKMKEKGDASIFVGYSTQSRAYRVFNKRTRVIVETIHVNFDELPQMASDHISSDPTPECQTTALEHDSLSLGPHCQDTVTHADKIVTTSNELDLLFNPMFDELLNGSSQVVSKSSAVTTTDAPNQRQQQQTTPLINQQTPEPTCQVLTQAPTVTSTENINQAETNSENAQVADDKFINIFCTPVQDRGETLSRHVDSSNMHTFYQRYPSKHRWTKNHSLEQVIGNPSQSVRTRHKVYRLKKALYGLKQAPRAWYDELSNFLLSKGFSKGSIDPTLFITKHGEDILLVQIYVDDIIFGSTNSKLLKRFEKLMHSKFKMSMMGELKFFLGIQINQSPRGIFINQAKYTQEILKKHGMTSCDSIGTPMATKHLDADLSGTPVDQMKYRSMVRALMYLTASKLDIMHTTCYYARYQAKPTEKHLTAVKRIFRYLKDTIHMGLWYPKDTGFELTAFSDSDHAGCLDSCKSTSGGIQFLGGDKLVSWSSKKQDCTLMSSVEAEYHFIKEKVKKGIVELFFVGTEYQLADLFTKALPEERFKYLVRRLETMADININDPAGQATAMAPPVRTDDQILPRIRWVPIGKSNSYLDLEKSQSNPIYKIAVDLLKHTNFFRAFTASSTIPLIYIQQYWDTIQYDQTAGCYRFFEASSHEPILIMPRGSGKNLPNPYIPLLRTNRICLDIQHRRHRFYPRPNSPFHLPNEEPVLGYLKFSAKGTKREVFGIPIPGSLITADIQEASYYQEYLANMAKHRQYLADETGSDPDSPAPKPTKPARKPKSTAPKAPLWPSISTPVTSAQPVPTSAPAKPQQKKRKQTTETSDRPPKAKKSKYRFIGKKRTLKYVAASEAEDVPAKEPQVAAEDADLQKALEESIKTMYAAPQGPLPPVVIREPESGKYQPLLEVPGKGKAKAHLHTYWIAQAEGQTGSDVGTQDEGQTGSNPDEISEGQARPDPGNAGADVQSIPSSVVHAGSDREHMDLDVADVSSQPSMEQLDEEFTITAYPKVQENLKLTVEEQVLLEEPASSSGTLSSLQHLSKDISFGDLFFSDKPSEADNDKTTAETKVESIVSVTIQQDMSSIPLMTSPIIDLTSRPESPKVHQQFKATTTETTTTTTTTTLPPPPPQQQSTTEAMMMKSIDELEHIMANLIQENKEMEDRLDKHGARLYKLEQLDIPQQVSKAVSEVVTDAVD